MLTVWQVRPATSSLMSLLWEMGVVTVPPLGGPTRTERSNAGSELVPSGAVISSAVIMVDALAEFYVSVCWGCWDDTHSFILISF